MCMTLIVGTTHWKGICLNADTRATRSNGTYVDNAQKIAHVKGGIGMAAAGDCQSAVMVRDTLIKRLDKILGDGTKVNDEDMISFMRQTILETLQEVKDHPLAGSKPIYDIKSKGLIGVSLPFLPLILTHDEAENLVGILLSGSKLNSIYSRHIEQIAACANNEFRTIRIEEFPLSVLYTYTIKLYDDPSDCVYEVNTVPFGKMVAYGSGANFDYPTKTPRILSWVLFSPEAEDIDYATLHLAQTLFYADKEIPVDARYGFKTFGGGLIAGIIRSRPNGYSSTDIVLGDMGSKESGKIVLRTYEKSGKLWVETKEGKHLELVPFPEYTNGLNSSIEFNLD